ncbi:MAG: NusG domain II-containing protein [bacterium]
MTSDLFSVRGLWRALTPADRIVSLALLLGSIALGVAARPSGEPTAAVVTVGGEVVATLPLDRDSRVEVQGRLSPVTIEVSGHAVRVTESACPHRICVRMGPRRHSGEIIACVPNALVVRLTGGAPDAGVPDAVTG